MFKPDSPLMRTMSRITDLLILNLLFVFSCLPVITIGPAVTALYAVSFTIGTTREDGVLLPYLTAFRSNFKAALKIWLILLGVGLALALDVLLVNTFPAPLSFLSVGFFALILLELLACAMIFPLLSLFRSGTLALLKNALALSLGHLPRSVAILCMWCFPVYLMFRFPFVFFSTMFIFLVIYFAGAAYLSALLLRKVFEPWVPEDLFEEEKA